jgi:membrane-bound lytic murein transglycosylase F
MVAKIRKKREICQLKIAHFSFFCCNFAAVIRINFFKSWPAQGVMLLGGVLLLACSQRRQEAVVMPWGDSIQAGNPVANTFDLDEIQTNGELIGLTLSGPTTYYDYRGKHLGAQYLLALRFAERIGVSLRMEVCRDTAEMLQRLKAGEADFICYPLSREGCGWMVGRHKPELVQELDDWYEPSMLDEVRRQEDFLLSSRSVKRRIFSPMLNRQGGVISHYDGYFRHYATSIRWDWRLLAAQSYQESTFDPEARSWAGACGLMQIMPATADHLGLARSDMFHPEKNIAAAVKYLGELEQNFSDIPQRLERTKFVLAAYNGGHFHIRDAMALASKNGRNPKLWRDVEPYVLGLSQPHFYNDAVVKNGYMRGSETVEYVRKIMERWNSYRGVKFSTASGLNGTPQKAKKERKKKYMI